jgi:lipopolysaccharide transport system ATP-binding protein
MEKALEAHVVSKKYVIGVPKSTSFRDFFGRKVSFLNTNSGEKTTDFWALKDVSFQVNRGDVVGVIGRNGAGKSTLLKIISNITKPTSGKIDIYGRIASLLEVGTGFHPELTGRENVYLNGTILGMSRSEVNRKFDEIIDFSGISKFIDTPVKRYSSGMSVRLAFAVAAHLDPEILIVDEVLAVGDADFQKKCLGKMDEVSKKEGRTILFVSHSLPALKAICKKGILLEKGQLVMQSSIEDAIKKYSETVVDVDTALSSVEYYNTDVLEVASLGINGYPYAHFIQDSRVLKVDVEIIFKKRTTFELDLHITKDDDYVASYANFVHHDTSFYEPGKYHFKYEIALPEILSGFYAIDMYFTEPFVRRYAGSKNQIRFEVVNETHSSFLNVQGMTWGEVLLRGSVDVHKLS